MIVKTITFKSVIIKSFNRNELVLQIIYNDGSKDNVLEKKTELQDVNTFSDELLAEVRTLAKKSTSNNGGFLGDVIVINFPEDEEKVYERLYATFGRVRDEVRKIRSTKVAQNFLQSYANINGAKFNF
ncbi:MAG TPA: hypothetical protein VKE88_02065 [Candidatus Nanoarchaeia archaeon]|nr:hypothetical protein [Candidatus Nanoarchaeia archaeon]